MAALDLLGRRWSLRVLWELHDGPIGFRALQAACDSMSSSVLSARLGELVEAGLVVRVDDDYAYSPIGVELATALAPLSDWSRRWRDTLSRRPTTT
jgi:DNA-binding HxlR family transcriptional regulator